MKASSATSAKASTLARPTGRSSASQPSPIKAEGFALSGPSDLPDAAYNAYRPDLADCALVGQVIASHYAEPLDRVVTKAAVLLAAPADSAEPLQDLKSGDPFAMLDNSLGWAWGYAGKARRVGYVRSEKVGAP